MLICIQTTYKLHLKFVNHLFACENYLLRSFLLISSILSQECPFADFIIMPNLSARHSHLNTVYFVSTTISVKPKVLAILVVAKTLVTTSSCNSHTLTLLLWYGIIF